MKHINLVRSNEMSIQEIDLPKLQNLNDVLIKIEAVGICGSDIHYYKHGKIGDQIINYPFSLGHECSGIVVEIGSDVRNLLPGYRVAIDPLISCGTCSQCLNGREHTCLNQKFLGCPGQLEGCLSEYVVLPERNCFRIPNEMSAETAVLVEPLSIGYYATQFMNHIANVETVAILGAGPIGLSVALSLKTVGINSIYMTDILDYRLSFSHTAGAIWTGNPHKEDVVNILKTKNPSLFDIVFECCGKQEALDQAIELLKPGGMLLIVGIPETNRISFDISKIRRKEITIQNVRRQNNCIQPVIDLISTGKLCPDFLITHIFPFHKTKDAFNLVAEYQENVIKAIIRL
jgi:L-iditol 2-dehydrogenase